MSLAAEIISREALEFGGRQGAGGEFIQTSTWQMGQNVLPRGHQSLPRGNITSTWLGASALLTVIEQAAQVM